MGRPRQSASMDGAHADVPVAATLKARDQRRPLQDDQVTCDVRVKASLATWSLNSWIKVLVLPKIITIALATLDFLRVAKWMQFKRSKFWRTSSRRHQVANLYLPLNSSCPSTGCKKYRAHIEPSTNWHQNSYRISSQSLYDGWKQLHSVLTEDMMYNHALVYVAEKASEYVRFSHTAANTTWRVRQRVPSLITSWMQFTNSLRDLKTFIFEHHLSCSIISIRYFFGTLHHFSKNWNHSLWFQVTLDLAPYRGGTGVPLPEIGRSAAFRAWIVLMHVITDQGRGAPPSHHCKNNARCVPGLIGFTQSQAVELAAAIQEMDWLTLEMLENNMADRKQKSAVHVFAESVTFGILTGHGIPHFTEYFHFKLLFYANNELHISNLGLLRVAGYLPRRSTATREALTLTLGLFMVTKLGWMVDQESDGGTLFTVVPSWSSSIFCCCLIQVQNSTRTASSSLFLENQVNKARARNGPDILANAGICQRIAVIYLMATKRTAQWSTESCLESVFTQSSTESSFFFSWKTLLLVESWRQHHNLSFLKPTPVLVHMWIVQGAFTASDEYSLLPLYSCGQPSEFNYDDTPRQVTDETARGPFYEPHHYQQHACRDTYVSDSTKAGTTKSLPERSLTMSTRSCYWRYENLRTEREVTPYRCSFQRVEPCGRQALLLENGGLRTTGSSSRERSLADDRFFLQRMEPCGQHALLPENGGLRTTDSSFRERSLGEYRLFFQRAEPCRRQALPENRALRMIGSSSRERSLADERLFLRAEPCGRQALLPKNGALRMTGSSSREQSLADDRLFLRASLAADRLFQRMEPCG
ncbi:uncharacterized protein LOC144129669 [Amblyomma americanum]